MGERLGLASWGTGTRRLAALQVAAANQTDAPLTVVDELERGLEPHRQRVLVRDMMERDSQAFVTTHSPVALSAASGASLLHVGTDRALKHAARDPETFLCRLPIVVEGATEVGFVKGLLDRTIAGALLDLGVWVTDGGGHEATLSLLQVLSSAGVSAGGFADDEEGKYQGRWESVRDYLGDLLFRWPTGATEANVLAVIEEDDLQRFVEDPDDELTGERLRTMAERIGSTEDKSWGSLQSNCDHLKGLVLASALGEVPDPIPEDGDAKRYRKHSRHWFKTERGGRELVDKLFALGNFTALEPELLRFVNAVRNSLGMEPLDRLR